MSRVRFMSPYLKGGRDAAKLSNRTRYIATRPGVEVLRGEYSDQPATDKQQAYIQRLLRDFPGAEELLEYEDYVQKPTKAHASSLITLILEEYWKQVQQTDGYLKYIAMQPRAERLGYNNAQAWRALLRAHHNDIAAAMHFHVSYIFQHNAAAVTAQPRLHIDCKQMQELQKLRIALGHQPDNHEEEQTRSRGGMTMKGW